MKIAIPYFADAPAPGRAHHAVADGQLDAWAFFYARSGNALEVCLLTDAATPVPASWPHGVRRLADSEPPRRGDALHKVGWLKHQATDALGHCLVLDLDTIVRGDLAPLAEVQGEIAMAPDAGSTWEQAGEYGWTEVGAKHNAGVMVLRSRRIKSMFRDAWAWRFAEHGHVTYLDELIFSELRGRLGGPTLPERYNVMPPPDEGNERLWSWLRAGAGDAAIVHFRGGDKARMVRLREYLR